MTNVPCPCCGNPTLSARSRFEICPVCCWEDDGQDDADAHEVRGGPNGMLSLSDARANFALIGAADPRHVHSTRRPRDSEQPSALEDGLALRRRVAAALRAAVLAHERGAFEDIRSQHDQLERLPLGPDDRDVNTAINFLDGWCDASNHNWSRYEPLVAAEWPALATRLAADLESGTPIPDTVRDKFEFRPSRGALARLRGLFTTSPRRPASPPPGPVLVPKRYISWGREDIENLPVEWTRVVTEIDPNGRVLREIGLNTQGGVIHRAPSARDNHGLFGQVPVDAGPDSDATAEEFESWWHAPLEPRGR